MTSEMQAHAMLISRCRLHVSSQMTLPFGFSRMLSALSKWYGVEITRYLHVATRKLTKEIPVTTAEMRIDTLTFGFLSQRVGRISEA
ncbi:hypothetical protein [Bradyrhizobium sp. SRS-191]|uniref:hypothetical protein n=1 Tax=Bradyrhizobium sp. SRS-191 TaxID=2962606 RepID=UPI00211E6260|nr:hypothetical protein [Bradyrhizobium sp. SRS-191]